MPDKPTPWEVFYKAGWLTETQLKVIIMIIDEFLKGQGGRMITINKTRSVGFSHPLNPNGKEVRNARANRTKS